MTAFACPHCGQLVAIPEGGQVGQRFRCPKCQQKIVLEQRASKKKSEPSVPSVPRQETASLPPDWIALDPPSDPIQSSKPTIQSGRPRGPGESKSPEKRPPAAKSDVRPASELETLSALGAGGATHGLRAPGIEPPKRRRPLGRWLVPGGVVLGLVIVGALLAWNPFANRGRPPASAPAAALSHEAVPPTRRAAVTEPRKSTGDLTQSNRHANAIRLLLAPAGVRVVVHLRPAALWSAAAPSRAARPSRSEELRRCLGPLSTWAEKQIAERCLFSPDQIDEALFSLVLRSPGDPPDVAATVWLKDAVASEEIAKRFGGQKAEQGKLATWIRGDRALVIRDGKTFAVGPQSAAQEMADANAQPNPTDASIEELLKETDRGREMTFVFRPDDLDRFRESLFPPAFQEVAHQVARWLDPEATEGVLLSFRLEDPFRIRLSLRTRPTMGVHRLEEDVQQRLDRLPKQLLADVESLNPQTGGHRKLVGRVPAMWKAVALGMHSTIEPRLATFESVLPERAAPNLSLGTYLALTAPRSDSVLRSGRGRGRPGEKRTVAERLATKVDVDFRRTPLSDAFASIGEDIGVTFEIDGGALKVVGYTKNMPQSFRLAGVSATEALRTILKPYPKMALVVDERRQTVTVTTTEAAATKGLKLLNLEK
jgi:DNA-directed RNA polymerase subunit RPC12/RpoP